MNIQPPIAFRFHEINASQIELARAGICPHCPRPVEGRPAQTLETKHSCEAIQFKQCSRCMVVVALERQS